MSLRLHSFPCLRLEYGYAWKLFNVIMIGFCIFIFPGAMVSAASNNSGASVSANDSKAVFEQAVADYFSGRYGQAQKRFNELRNTDYAAASAVPAAVNLVAMGKYTSAQQAFGQIQKSTNVREKEYAKLWELWLTAKLWRGSNKGLINKLNKLVAAHDWQPSYMQDIAKVYAGQENVEDLFNSLSTQGLDEASHKDAFTEATFFAGGYLQNVKHNNAAAMQLFNDNLNKLNSVSLERPFIDRECASLNKLTHHSK